MTIARDRIELLLDDDSPFLELCPLAGYGQEDMTVGGSQVAGIGLIWYDGPNFCTRSEGRF